VFSAVVTGTTPDGVPIVDLVDVLSDTGLDRGSLFDAVCTVLGA
jgi:hypothetical protein